MRTSETLNTSELVASRQLSSSITSKLKNLYRNKSFTIISLDKMKHGTQCGNIICIIREKYDYINM